ncbi:uncharacterized protein LOC106129607 isoform X1 [Amyelois transitella]|uniref:uncharacterized protein LOC106129607 isoform X1 n=1 Tax=Amyelois transitella TaxID=680683 RepID=UPI00298FFF6E|nr:uncharacterized protein LOC106129607 isoform X1 [Amyelois transitella]
MRCRYYTELTLGWMLNNKMIVFLGLLSFSLFVSTLALAGQRNRYKAEVEELLSSTSVNPPTVTDQTIPTNPATDETTETSSGSVEVETTTEIPTTVTVNTETVTETETTESTTAGTDENRVVPKEKASLTQDDLEKTQIKDDIRPQTAVVSENSVINSESEIDSLKVRRNNEKVEDTVQQSRFLLRDSKLFEALGANA